MFLLSSCCIVSCCCCELEEAEHESEEPLSKHVDTPEPVQQMVLAGVTSDAMEEVRARMGLSIEPTEVLRATFLLLLLLLLLLCTTA